MLRSRESHYTYLEDTVTKWKKKNNLKDKKHSV